MRIVNVQQNSPEWLQVRAGIPTASCFKKILTSNGKASTQAHGYMMQLAAERLTGQPCGSTYRSESMERGNLLESEAAQFYEMMTGEKTEQVGFCVTEQFPVIGCSPDRMVGTKKLTQIKCPEPHTHVEYLMSQEMPSEYFVQVQGELLVTERECNDFLSYHPLMKPFLIPVYRDERFISTLKEALKAFCTRLEETVSKLKGA